MRIELAGVAIESVTGDIAAQDDIEIVVNAANADLMPGGGVAGAIHRAAGAELAEAGRPFAPIEPGQAVITGAFNLPNRYVVHCLGPVYGRDEPAASLLARCYENALALAEQRSVQSVAFPAISSGAFGYPLEDAAEVAVNAVAACAGDMRYVRLVRFVLFDEHTSKVFEAQLKRLGQSVT